MFSIPALDNLSEEELGERVREWVQHRGPICADVVSVDQAWNLFLPRTAFVKSLPTGSKLLDVGAGDGGIAVFKKWPLFEREDLKLYALSLSVGEHFSLYEDYEIKNFEKDPDVFPGIQFDAMVCSHFIEHMSDPKPTIEFFSRKMRSGGRLYLEWPHSLTKRFPRRSGFAEQGIDIGTMNFFDDGSHIETWLPQQLIELLEKNGFAVETGGRIYLPWVADQMRNHALADGDKTRLTLAVWAGFGWAQYMILSKL